MPRTIKIGDKVQAFLDAKIKGTVTEITQGKTISNTSGGTLAGNFRVCTVLSSTGETFRVPLSEVFITDY